MKYIWEYKTPEGFDDIVMSGDGEALTNSLTGYGGGLGNKISLLAHEGSDFFDVRLSAPKDRNEEIDGKLVRRCIRRLRNGILNVKCQRCSLHGVAWGLRSLLAMLLTLGQVEWYNIDVLKH